MRTILFLCTGNSCRSVMAAEMFKKMLGPGANKKIEVLSAGTGTIAGMQATDHTAKVLQREGIDVSRHRSLPVTKELLEKADLILVMERFHKFMVLEIAPDIKGKVHLLREFEKDPQEAVEPEILDPIGRPLEVYERSFELIKDGLENLIKRLKESGWIMEDKAE